MRHLAFKAFAGLAFTALVMALLIFGVAGTVDYWQGWGFLTTFAGLSLLITLHLLATDRGLLERRVRGGVAAEQRPMQRLIQAVTTLLFIAVLVVPALDHRCGWSVVPPAAVACGDCLVAAGFLVVWRVYRANSFASATIEIAPGQTVVTTGPYALVRHPMYAGALVVYAGIAPALGSWWGALALLLFVPALCWRLLDEERFLERELPGYREYELRVRHRLLPFLW